MNAVVQNEPVITVEAKIRYELGTYIERKITEQEPLLKEKGLIEPDKKLTQSQVARMVGISVVWMNNICRGEKMPSNEILQAIVEALLLNEDEVFRIARRLPPRIVEKMKQEFLEEYYIPNLDI